ncbi:N-acetylmuramoyl-L-alanine amidase [Candidatus Woesearchaeota archaeon]|nr:N-acetylmuramoyl-L-alanine amidase [Candidatus Woesearchaeota archaeon]
MKLLNSKKALIEITLTPTFITLLVLGFILLSLLFKISLIGSNTQFEKNALAIDMGIAIDSLYATQCNAQYVYTGLAPFNFSYATDPEIIEVFEGKDPAKDDSKGVFYFTEDGPGGIVFHHKDLIPKNKTIISTVFILKQGDEIFFDSPQLNKKFRTNFNILSCPNERIKLTKSDTIFVDPGHGWDNNKSLGDKGQIGPANHIESEITLDIAKVLRGTLNRVSKVESTRGFTKDTNMPIAKKIQNAQSADAIISVHVGSKDNTALAYFNVNSKKKKQSIRLGCKILNELSKEYPEIKNIAFVPVNVENQARFDSSSPYQILSEDKVAVLLELGNIKKPTPNFIIDDQRDLAMVILEGVEKYNVG